MAGSSAIRNSSGSSAPGSGPWKLQRIKGQGSCPARASWPTRPTSWPAGRRTAG
jgi:hypothetical protein